MKSKKKNKNLTSNTSTEDLNTAVIMYVKDIVDCIKEHDYTLDIDIDTVEMANVKETEIANGAVITTQLGAVAVMPDFVKRNAKACIVKLGEISRLYKEGFDEEFIDTKGQIYGSLMSFNEKNVKALGYYLTHKIDFNE